ncbi:hypothetical protein FLAG1_10262 [Fusarium langsethiae]|uniref:Uncharacterized protein n=1 Tax=Fusarium langsethiae TaxID=179993 RepID=A0A0M9EP05_FUSLA|nr:hypothetical protein FLAG1_10262 [Fusarium langsethiae]GKU22061.1 unnamed protein product [Fusarium langsethiae]
MAKSIILTLLLSTTVLASNPLFGAYSTDQCDTCLDQTFESCPGDYQTRPYATCMCAGDGSANFVSCLSSCDTSLNEPANASATYYGYCLMFFKELCDGAQQFVDEETYAEQCSEEAIKAGGIGEKGNDSGDDGESDKESDSNGDDDSNEGTGIAVLTKTNESASEKTNETGEANETDAATTTDGSSKTSETAQTTSGARATAIPAVALFAGLGVQFINA